MKFKLVNSVCYKNLILAHIVTYVGSIGKQFSGSYLGSYPHRAVIIEQLSFVSYSHVYILNIHSL